MTRSSWRPRPVALVAAPVAALLALTACGDGKDDKPKDAAAATSQPAPGSAGSADGPLTEKGSGPLPQVQPDQVKTLVGKWVSDSPAKDYFLFKSDGTASWMAQGRSLWAGQVIPDGANKFRFSWEGKDPQKASYWGVTVNANGKTLVFPGTNQVYTKAKS